MTCTRAAFSQGGSRRLYTVNSRPSQHFQQAKHQVDRRLRQHGIQGLKGQRWMLKRAAARSPTTEQSSCKSKCLHLYSVCTAPVDRAGDAGMPCCASLSRSEGSASRFRASAEHIAKLALHHTPLHMIARLQQAPETARLLASELLMSCSRLLGGREDGGGEPAKSGVMGQSRGSMGSHGGSGRSFWHAKADLTGLQPRLPAGGVLGLC